MAVWPLTAQAVADNAEVTGVSGDSVPLMSATAAAVAWVQGTARPDLPWTAPGVEPSYTPPADVWLGSVMLAWRWYERRASPLGVVLAPTGDPVEILRNDPDIARLLGIAGGSEGAFIFGAGLIPTAEETASGIIGYDPDGTPVWNGPLDPDGTPVLP